MKKNNLFVSVLLIVVLAMSVVGVVGADHHMSDEPARVRVAHLAIDAPSVDVFVDGAAVLEDVAYTTVSDYLKVPGGSYEIAVAPADAGLEAAVIGPVALEFTNGHSYTIAATGQLADGSFGPVVIDETAAFESDMMAADEMMEPMAKVLVLHGISDAPAVDLILKGSTDAAPLIAGAAFNDYAALEVPAGDYPLAVTAAGDAATIVFDLDPTVLMADTYYFLAATGTFPDDFMIVANAVPTKNIAEVAAGAGSFETLLAAVEAAGLTETLSNEGPFTVFAPTDEAFAAAFDALGIAPADLLADTETLTSILLYHVVDGEVRAETVVGLDSASTLQGSDVSITVTDDGVFLNESIQVIMTDVAAENGVIHVIDGVLLPPAN